MATEFPVTRGFDVVVLATQGNQSVDEHREQSFAFLLRGDVWITHHAMFHFPPALRESTPSGS